MISTGNKVEVLISSTKKKGSNIRKGSTGYVATVGETHIVSNRIPIIVTPSKIVFIRYGYEGIKRCEAKVVLLVHPSNDSVIIKNKKAHLRRMVKQTLDVDPDTKKRIFTDTGVNNATAVIVRNSSISNNITNDKEEFLAWFRSISLSGELHKLLFCMPTDPANKTKQLLKETSLITLNECISKFAFMKKYVDNLFSEGVCSKKGIALATSLQEILQLKSMQTLHDKTNMVKGNPFSNNNILVLFWMLALNNIPFEDDKHGGSRYKRDSYTRIKTWVSVLNKIRNI